MACTEMKLCVIELRKWDAVTWCGRRMQYHVYSHFLCGGSLMITSETLLWALLKPKSHKRNGEKGCFVFSLYLDAETQTEIRCCREKSERTIKKSLRAQAGACWEELHSAATHASLSQRPLTKDLTYFSWDYSAILPVSFINLSASYIIPHYFNKASTQHVAHVH